MNTTGSWRTPAKFMPSWVSPRADRALAEPGRPRRGAPRGCETRVPRRPRPGSIAGRWLTIAIRPEAHVGHVHVAVAPCVGPVLAAHVVREDPPRLDAARDVDAHVAMQRRADVLGLHRRRDADRRGLVAAPRVERAGDLALAIEDVAAFLDPARDQHVAVDLEQVLAVEARLLHLLKRAAGLGHACDRHCTVL